MYRWIRLLPIEKFSAILGLTVLSFELSRLEIWDFNISSFGKSFRVLIILRIWDKLSGVDVAENYETVGKFHKNINFFFKSYLTVYLEKLFRNKRPKTRIKRKWNPYFRSTDGSVISSGEFGIGSRVINVARRLPKFSCIRLVSLCLFSMLLTIEGLSVVLF